MNTDLRYIDLLNMLQKMSPERLQDNVAVRVAPDEYFGAGSIFLKVADHENGVLDAGHLFIEVAEGL